MGVDATRTVRIDFIAEDKGLGAGVSSVKSQLVAVAAVAATAAAAIKFVGDETERLDETAKAFEKSGLDNIKIYQELQQVAKLGGSDVGKLSKATVRLDRNLFAISQKSGKAANDAIKALNLTAKGLAEADGTERLGILADALLEVDDRGRRAALAEELLGRSGRDLLPVLKEGSEGLDAMVESIDKTFTRDDLAKAEAYQDALVNLQKTSEDVKTEIVLGVAPALTEFADELRASGEQASDVLPTIVALLKNMTTALGPPLKVLGFFAGQLATVGRVADFFGARVDTATDAVSDLAQGAVDFVSDSPIGDWARDASEGLDSMGAGTDGLTDDLRDQIPIVEDLGQSWDELARAITGAEAARSDISLIGDAKAAIGEVLNLGKAFQDQQEDEAETNADRVASLEAQAIESDFLAKLGAAQGDTQAEVNAQIIAGLDLRRQAAQLQFDLTQSTEDEAKLLAATRAVALAQAGKPSSGGGRRVSQVQKFVALGEQSVSLLEQQAKLASTLAGDTAEAAAAEQLMFDAQRARLDLERRALDMTKARREFAKQELDNKIAAKDAEIELLDAEDRVAAREREAAATENVLSIEQARNTADAEAAARRLELMGMEFEARELLRQQEEQALLADPPEKELERIERRDRLDQLAFDRQMDRSQRAAQDAAKRAEHEEALHDAELKRIKEKEQATKAAVGATSRFLAQGQQFASAVIGAAIKDEEKRAQAELKARGVMAIATGALEVVRGVASAASFNVVEAALHFGAASLAFVQGGIMLGGNLPGRGAAGASGATSAAPPAADRDTSEAARIVESVPAADLEPAQQPTGSQVAAGNVVNIETITVTGAIDDTTIEKIKIGLDDVNNGLEETG